MKELDSLINQYVEVTKQLDEITLKKNDLRSSILSMMCGTDKYTSDSGTTASVIMKTTISYPDENALLQRLHELNLDTYIIKTIDKKRFNDAVKKQQSIKDSVSSLISVVESKELRVK